MAEAVTEMPRSRSTASQSLEPAPLPLREPVVSGVWIAPPRRSRRSVSVVLPASGWEMMPNVRRRATAASSAASARAASAAACVASDALSGARRAGRGRRATGRGRATGPRLRRARAAQRRGRKLRPNRRGGPLFVANKHSPPCPDDAHRPPPRLRDHGAHRRQQALLHRDDGPAARQALRQPGRRLAPTTSSTPTRRAARART